MSLRLRWLGWAIQPMRYCVRFTDIGHTGHSERQKYRERDEEDRASKRESLPSAPALGERRHRRSGVILRHIGEQRGPPSLCALGKSHLVPLTVAVLVMGLASSCSTDRS